MDEKTRVVWALLGERLAVAGPEKFDQVVERLTDVVEAQELISEYDYQLFLRGRPRKRYLA